MTELPSAQAANLGLGPRKFRLRDGPDMSDRSCWTDTPAQKAQKQMDLVNIKNMHLCFKLQNAKHSICVTIKALEFYICANVMLIAFFLESKKTQGTRKETCK